MPRSTRHKSSKHSSREAREHSDSEKDSSLRDRKGKEESGGVSRVPKESGSSEKRKVDSLKEAKDLYGSGNGEYSEDHGPSKRRRERAGDGVSDRWNGGEEDRNEVSKRSKESKALGEPKSSGSSKRREEGLGVYGEGAEAKKSSGKHRDSGRKESREGGNEREKKIKEAKSDRLVVENEEQRESKKAVEKTDLNAQEELRSLEENQLEKRVRKRRDGSGDWEKHQDDIIEINDRRFSSRDDIGKDGRQKDEKRKDERGKDKYMDRDNKHRDEKQSDDCPAKDQSSIKSDDKHLRDEKDAVEVRQKRVKDIDRERERERDRDPGRERDRDRDRGHGREREREHDGDHGHGRHRDRDSDRDYELDWDRDRDRGLDRIRDRGREHDREYDHDRERDQDRDRHRDRERDQDRDRHRDQDRDRDRDRDRHHGRDVSHLDDRSVGYKDGRGKKRSPDDRDDSNDNKTRLVKANHPDVENKSLSGSKVELDADMGRSQSRQSHVDTPISSNRRRTSPSSSSYVGVDEYRHSNLEDVKYGDNKSQQRPKAISSREMSAFSGVPEKGAKYRSMERTVKTDDSHLGELSTERSSSSKASPKGLVERSPSSSSLDRRYMNRSGVRRSLDIDETGRRSIASIDARDFPMTEDRLYRDFPLEKPPMDDSSQADSPYYNRTSLSNASSLIPLPSAFRAGVDSPSFVGSLEEDGRLNSTARYKRGSDSGMGRGHGNAWRGGVPSWSSSMPNGFIPFQHGPPHGGFQAMIPQFPSQPLFGVRPVVELNHSGIHYHIPEADRFSGHLRPVGWQNMMDGSGPPHLHGWDGSNGSGPPRLYGGPEWDQKRNLMNGRGWESNADLWKGQDADMKRDLASPSHKDDYPVLATVDDTLGVKAGQRSHHEDNYQEVQAKTTEISSTGTSPAQEAFETLPKPIHEKAADHSKISSDDVSHFNIFYLSKLDISAELARPELYSQFINLLDIEQRETADVDTITDVFVEDVGRTGLKCSNNLSHSPFPAIKDSVLQRAMDLYKKQRVEVVRRLPVAVGTLGIISPSNQETQEEQGPPIGNAVKTEEPVRILDLEMPSAHKSAVDEKGVEAVSTVVMQENMEEPVSSPTEEFQNHVGTPPQREVLVQAYGGENQGVSLAVSSDEKKDRMPSEPVNLEVGDGDSILKGDNELQTTAATIFMDGENIKGIGKTKTICENSACSVDEGLSGDAINEPKCYPVGSPRACEAMMPGSNESESVILSRIHHSPESTH